LACSHEELKASNIYELSGKAADMVMKQSLNAGTVDNISCIFICFNNFKQAIQQKFQGSINNQNKEPKSFDVKNEYAMISKEQPGLINFEEIRRKLNFVKENSIPLMKNENIKLSKYDQAQNIYAEKKPKTSSETNKSNRLELINANYPEANNIDNYEFHSNNINTDSNANGDLDKFLYKIDSKKIKMPGIASYKNYESNLPTFKISQRINKAPHKELNNLKNSSPTNRINSNSHQMSYNNFGTNNMNYTSKNNRFLPNIINNKNVGHTNPSTSIYGEKNSNNLKFSKGLQFNYNFNK